MSSLCFPFSQFLNCIGLQLTKYLTLEVFPKALQYKPHFCAASCRKKWTIAKLSQKTTSKIQCGLITSRGKSLQQPQNMGACTTTLWTNLNVFFLLDNFKSGLQNTSFLLLSTHITSTLIMFQLCITADWTHWRITQPPPSKDNQQLSPKLESRVRNSNIFTNDIPPTTQQASEAHQIWERHNI